MKLTNYNNSNTYRNPTSLIESFFNRDPFDHPFFWGDVSRTGDTVRFKEGDELTVEVDLPGVSKDKTTVSVEGRVVSIEALVRSSIRVDRKRKPSAAVLLSAIVTTWIKLRLNRKMVFLLWYFLRTKWKTAARKLLILTNCIAS